MTSEELKEKRWKALDWIQAAQIALGLFAIFTVVGRLQTSSSIKWYDICWPLLYIFQVVDARRWRLLWRKMADDHIKMMEDHLKWLKSQLPKGE